MSCLPTESAAAGGPTPPERLPSPGPVPARGALDPGAFTPGTLIGGRYRIVGLLGRGGMGEVYRADDLRLGQAVALKFLPASVSADPALLGLFHEEVRLARQVSHPNVCRVYDVSEAGDRHFLSMEYVDGEDLASLLKRIGRLPADKAVEVARELCAGVAAAHEKGVLHRDLKPANVMLDGRGRDRVTDFGLAVTGEEAASRLDLAGTPAYMPPELFAGRPASVRSDLYALGLVLYEVFTGRRAFDAASFAEARRMHAEELPAPPSGVSPGVDPVVDRVILRCLEKDPAARPSSALQVASALPGGDPLAAALAAGETPSPEMVAAAGEAGTLEAGLAWARFALVVLLLVSVLLISGLSRDAGLAPPERSYDSLSDRAREIAVRLGWKADPADAHAAFERDYAFLSWMAANGRPGWARDLSSSWWTPALFRYRQSPRPLVPLNARGVVRADDPPTTVPGMLTLEIDTRGRLRRLLAVPRPAREGSGAPPPPWEPLLAEAGLEARAFAPAEPAWLPPVPFDAIAGWVGTVPGLPGTPLAVVAAAQAGRPVYFELIAPWGEAAREAARPVPVRAQVTEAVQVFLAACFTLAGLALARRNLRLGRGDRAGAVRFASASLVLALTSYVLGRHPGFAPGALDRAFWETLGMALAPAFLVAVVYLALEPYFRRRYPELLVSWARLVSGRFRDPLVGRDHLRGVLAGLAASLVLSLENVPPALLPARGQTPVSFDGPALSGLPGLASYAAYAVGESLVWLFFVAASLFFARLVFRKAALAAAATWLLLFLKSSGGENLLIELAGGAVLATILLAVFLRGGLLGLAVALAVFNLLSRAPITPDLSSWFAGYGLCCLGAVLVAATYGFWAARGGRLLGPARVDE